MGKLPLMLLSLNAREHLELQLSWTWTLGLGEQGFFVKQPFAAMCLLDSEDPPRITQGTSNLLPTLGPLPMSKHCVFEICSCRRSLQVLFRSSAWKRVGPEVLIPRSNQMIVYANTHTHTHTHTRSGIASLLSSGSRQERMRCIF